jgi:hypothetical protein
MREVGVGPSREYELVKSSKLEGYFVNYAKPNWRDINRKW